MRFQRLMSFGVGLTGLALAYAWTAQAQGTPQMVRLEIKSRSVAFGGTAFGTAGVYEKLVGVAHMEIDPKAPANRGIVDLQYAPRDARGMVEYDVDVTILRPRDPTKARRVMVYDVVNRGAKTISMMNKGTANLDASSDAGNGFVMRQGYTMVWSGWQGDVGSQGIGARFPAPKDGSKPLTGRVSTTSIFDNPTRNRMNLPFAAATLDQATARLTVRQRTDDPERVIAPADWHFDDDRHVTLTRPADMDPGAIYEFYYVARDPDAVMGLGFPAVRDLIAFLQHGSAAEGNVLADLASAPCERDAKGACPKADGVFNSTIAFGGSQSARYLRDFLWQGFNRDLGGRPVFNGMIPFIAGGRQTFTNMRFAEPNRFSRQHEDQDVPGFDFPFTYATLKDPVTGRTDGILARCSKDGTCPKVFQIDTSAEFWQAGASLVGTGGTDRDVAFPANVRAYMVAGGAHATGRTANNCQSPANPLDYSPVIRAMMVNMVDWTSGRQPPPASRWPSVAKGDLQRVTALKSPDLTSVGITWPKVVNHPNPPAGTPKGRAWPVLVPNVDADGNDAPGIRLPDLAAPNGTYLGWNLRKAGFAPGELCLIYGAFSPLAKDAATRGKDPRPSLAERYTAKPREAAAHETALALRRDRLLLDEDVEAMQRAAP